MDIARRQNRRAHALALALAFATASIAATAAPAAADTIGAGSVVGTLDYNPPLPLTGCNTTTFGINATLVGIVATTEAAAYTGTAALAGTAKGLCDRARDGRAIVTFAITGTDAGQSLSCPVIKGSSSRIGNELEFHGSGACTINGAAAGDVLFAFTTEFAPLLPPGAGTTEPMSTGGFAGTFTASA